MKIVITDSFIKSFKENIIDASKWYKLAFWGDKWYDLKRGIKNLIAYFKVVFRLYPWEGICALELVKIHLEQLLPCLKEGYEVEETLSPKLKNIERSIELLNNCLKDDYAERCGWTFNDDMLAPATEANAHALNKAVELENKEWDELFILLKDLKSWWN